MRNANSERQNPTLLQVNTRVLLNELTRKLNRTATLDEIPDELIVGWSEAGFEWIYLLSVWQTGEVGRQISRSNHPWRKEFEETLDDLTESDIIGSGFAVTGYTVAGSLGGPDALQRFRNRIGMAGMRLMLDFVPNHMAPDHPWIQDHPDWFIRGTDQDISRAPENFTWVKRKHDELILAYGRDPYFSGWPDTVQLNYGNNHLQEAMKGELRQIVSQCDGLRCDMAMLQLPEVFRRTWKVEIQPFWTDAIRQIKERYPEFVMMGEVYWDLEWEMQQQGFDYTYDKRLYDRLRRWEATPVRDHLRAGVDYQQRLARFLENHDEQRVAEVFPWDAHQAAAILTFLTPGLKFFHDGEFQGKRVKISPHLGRGPVEKPNLLIEAFYSRLVRLLKREIFHLGEWSLLESRSAWEGNPTHANFIAFSWVYHDQKLFAIVNYASYQGQAQVEFPFTEAGGQDIYLHELFSDETYQRKGDDLLQHGLFADLQGWGFHLFELRITNYE